MSGELLLELELLLPEQPRQTLGKQYGFGAAASGVGFKSTGQATDICLYFNKLFCFRKADKTTQVFAKHVPLTRRYIFAKSCSDQVLNDFVGIKLLFHSLALSRGGGNFLEESMPTGREEIVEKSQSQCKKMLPRQEFQQEITTHENASKKNARNWAGKHFLGGLRDHDHHMKIHSARICAYAMNPSWLTSLNSYPRQLLSSLLITLLILLHVVDSKEKTHAVIQIGNCSMGTTLQPCF